ncbi:MAG: PilZ domain-containing protein [Polyangiales bacterium]
MSSLAHTQRLEWLVSNPPNQRLDERYPHQVTVDLCWNRHRVRLVSCDVSYRGLFLATDTPPTLRQLVRLEILLSDRETLTLHAMAVHLVPPNDPHGRVPGVGVQFYAVDRTAASRWGRYIDEVRRETGRPTRPRCLGPTPTAIIARSAMKEIADSLRPPGMPARPAPAAPPAPIVAQVPAPRPPPLPPPLPGAAATAGSPARAMPSRRKFPRYDAELELDVRDLGELHRMLTRDVSHGGMFIVTDAPLDPGTRLLLQVIHPVSDERFDITAVVRRRETSPQGIGVEFVDLTANRREAFMSFIRASLPLEDVLLVDANDPDLA